MVTANVTEKAYLVTLVTTIAHFSNSVAILQQQAVVQFRRITWDKPLEVWTVATYVNGTLGLSAPLAWGLSRISFIE